MAIFHGTNGNDSFTGTASKDTVVFSGSAAGYEVLFLEADRKIQVRDIDFSDGNTGVDTLSNIDALSFADRTYAMKGVTEILVSPRSHSFNYSNSSPAMTTLADGSFIVAWNLWTLPNEDQVSFVYTQRYDATGAAMGGPTLVSNPNYYLYEAESPDIVALNNGGYIVAWQSQTEEGDYPDIYLQRYNASGNKVGGQIRVNTTTADFQFDPSIKVLSNGAFVVSWESYEQDGSGLGIYAQRFNAAGRKTGGETLVNTTTEGHQVSPDVIALADGAYVIVWAGTGHGGADGIFAQHFDARGNKVGAETRIDAGTDGYHDYTSMAALNGGGYVVVWSVYEQYDVDSFFQRFDAAGNKVGAETRVNTFTQGFQDKPVVAGLAGGGFVVVWKSVPDQDGEDSGVFAQRYDATGKKLGGETLINETTVGDQTNPAVTAMDDGGYAISWSGPNREDFNTSIYYHRYKANGELIVQNVSIDGTGGDDILNGGVGSQTLRGLDGHDRIFGGNGKDVLEGGLGADTLRGGGGADAFRFASDLKNGANVDSVVNFLSDDEIHLDNAIFRKLESETGVLNARHFRANASGNAVDANDYIIYERDTGNLFYDADGNGAGAKIKFAVIGNKAALTAADFEVV